MICPDRNAAVIVGQGTLGSILFQMLVRRSLSASWTQEAIVFLVDHDIVQPHNLASSGIYLPGDERDKKVIVARSWSRRVNPGLHVVALPHRVEDVGLGPFLESAAVFICADTYLGKMMASRRAWWAGVPLILVGELAGGDSLASRFRWFSPGPKAPCLQCNWDEEYHHLEVPFPCSRVNGSRPGPVTRLTVAARTASLMLEEAERFLRGDSDTEPTLEVRIYPEERRFTSLRPRHNPECRFDHRILDLGAMVRLPQDSAELTLGEVFALASQHLPGVTHLVLEQGAATGFACPDGHEWSLLQRLSLAPPSCPRCGSVGTPTDLTFHLTVEEAEAALHTLLTRLVPSGDVLPFVDEAGEVVHLRLAWPSAWRSAGEAVTIGGEPWR